MKLTKYVKKHCLIGFFFVQRKEHDTVDDNKKAKVAMTLRLIYVFSSHDLYILTTCNVEQE